MLKLIFTYSILFLYFNVSAQSIKLNYEPKGVIIMFNFDSLTIYTDTTVLFDLYRNNGNLKKYNSRVINFVQNEIHNSELDTIVFSGNFISFHDGVINKYQTDWYVDWAILKLTSENKLKMFDKHGVLVKKIKRKKIGTKKEGYMRKAYINKETGEELFSELLLSPT